jgi:hypothetical protein
MKAYHNDPAIKEKYIARMKAHIAADELIRGTGWEDGKGCAVGCTLDKYDHSAYPEELGFPESLGRLEDTIFEEMSYEKSKLFPLQFLEAVEPGVDLEMVIPKFLHWLLVDPEHGVIRFAVDDRQRKIIDDVADLYSHWIGGDKPDKKLWDAAGAAAGAAARAAWDAARAAAGAAAWAAAGDAAGDAAWDAARAARAAAGDAAWAAAWDAARAAGDAARAFDFQAEKLIELLKAA